MEGCPITRSKRNAGFTEIPFPNTAGKAYKFMKCVWGETQVHAFCQPRKRHCGCVTHQQLNGSKELKNWKQGCWFTPFAPGRAPDAGSRAGARTRSPFPQRQQGDAWPRCWVTVVPSPSAMRDNPETAPGWIHLLSYARHTAPPQRPFRANQRTHAGIRCSAKHWVKSVKCLVLKELQQPGCSSLGGSLLMRVGFWSRHCVTQQLPSAPLLTAASAAVTSHATTDLHVPRDTRWPQPCPCSGNCCRFYTPRMSCQEQFSTKASGCLFGESNSVES